MFDLLLKLCMVFGNRRKSAPSLTPVGPSKTSEKLCRRCMTEETWERLLLILNKNPSHVLLNQSLLNQDWLLSQEAFEGSGRHQRRKRHLPSKVKNLSHQQQELPMTFGRKRRLRINTNKKMMHPRSDPHLYLMLHLMMTFNPFRSFLNNKHFSSCQYFPCLRQYFFCFRHHCLPLCSI